MPIQEPPKKVEDIEYDENYSLNEWILQQKTLKQVRDIAKTVAPEHPYFFNLLNKKLDTFEEFKARDRKIYGITDPKPLPKK